MESEREKKKKANFIDIHIGRMRGKNDNVNAMEILVMISRMRISSGLLYILLCYM